MTESNKQINKKSFKSKALGKGNWRGRQRHRTLNVLFLVLCHGSVVKPDACAMIPSAFLLSGGRHHFLVHERVRL